MKRANNKKKIMDCCLVTWDNNKYGEYIQFMKQIYLETIILNF